MYQINNKSEIYYLYNCETDKHFYIGNKDDLLRLLANEFNTYGYKDSSRWSNDYFDRLNLTMDDTVHYYLLFEEDYYGIRPFVFYDGESRIIDIRLFFNESVQYYLEGKFPIRKYHYRRWNKKKHVYGRYKNEMPRTKRTKTINSIPEHKSFVRRRDKEFPMYTDDTYYTVSYSWKDQYKCKKQWGHKKHIDKNMNSIRYMLEEDNYDMDELLEEEFLEKAKAPRI